MVVKIITAFSLRENAYIEQSTESTDREGEIITPQAHAPTHTLESYLPRATKYPTAS